MEVKKADLQSFNKFGSIVSYPSGKPTSSAPDYRFWSDIAHYRIDGETEIGICTVYRQPVNKIDSMERHLRTPEILIPIDAPFVLPLLLEGEDTDKAEFFRVDVGEAVVIDKAVWHGACLPVGRQLSSYFVIFRRNTPHEDVEKKSIKEISVNL